MAVFTKEFSTIQRDVNSQNAFLREFTNLRKVMQLSNY